MKKHLMLLAVFGLVLFCSAAQAVELDVPFKAQVEPGIWGSNTVPGSHNCGPTSVLMVAAYHLGFTPTSQNIKDIDDWTVNVGMFTTVNGYNGNDTNADQLVQVAREYYGFQSVSKNNSSDLGLLEQTLLNGNPVIVGVRLNMVNYVTNNNGHFMVLIGMTDTDVIVNDPGHTYGDHYGNNPNGVENHYPISTFQASWATQNYCAVIIDGSAGRTSVVGQKGDGTVNPEMLAAFNLNGGGSALGAPIYSYTPATNNAYVSEWQPYTGALVQVFGGGSLNSCAVVYDSANSPNKAFVIHGRLWEYYRNNGGPSLMINGQFLGGPVTNEVYRTDDITGHQLAAQRFAHGYVINDTVTNVASVRTIDNPMFSLYVAGGGDPDSGIPLDDSNITIATIPGNGISLNLYANETSPTTVYLSGSAVTGTAYYRVYQDSQYLGTLNPTTLDYTVIGLTPSSSHTYYLEAVDGNSNVLATSATVPVTLPAAPGPQGMSIYLQPRTLAIDASWPAISGTSYYEVDLNGNLYNYFQNAQCSIYNLSNGQTYTVHVSAYSSTGEVLASGSASLTLGQNVSIITYDSPVILLPNQTYTRTYYIFNNTDDTVTDFVSNHSGIAVNSSWVTLDSNTYQLPSSVAPHSTAYLCSVTFQTGSDYTLSSSVAVSVWFEADGDMPSLGLLGVNRSFQDYLQVVRFTDPASDLPATMSVDASAVPLTMSNEANSACASFRYEVYLDGALVASLISPQLAVREVWETALDFSSIPSGVYDLMLVVNTDNAVQNVRTDNDVSHCVLTLNNTTLMDHERYEAEDAALTNVATDTDHAGFSGSGFVDEFESYGDIVGFSVTVPVDGTYRLDFGYANGYPDAASRHIWVDGEYFDSLEFPSLGTWDGWGTTAQLVSLTAGLHTIEISREWYDSGAINLDYLDVTQLPNSHQRYEAEDATLTNVVVDTGHYDYVGTGFVAGFEGSGDAVDFAVNVLRTATYRLRFRYGRGESSPATRNILIDNEYANRQTFIGLGTSWDTWGNSELLADLTAGAHTITVYYDWMNGGAINLDLLEITEVATVVDHVEAEDATLTSLGVNTGHWGYSGSGFVDGFDGSNRGANFAVTVTDAGQYQLVFRYGNGVNDEATRDVYVDGQLVGTITLPSLGQDQWDVWADAALVVNLTPGAHDICIWYNTGNQAAINLDYLEVRPAPALP